MVSVVVVESKWSISVLILFSLVYASQAILIAHFGFHCMEGKKFRLRLFSERKSYEFRPKWFLSNRNSLLFKSMPSAPWTKIPIFIFLNFWTFPVRIPLVGKSYGIRILVGKPVSFSKDIILLFTIQIVQPNKDSVFKLGFITPPFLDYAYSLFIFAYFGWIIGLEERCGDLIHI